MHWNVDHCPVAMQFDEPAAVACALPMDEGLARERAFSIELENSDQARALRYAFFAEREVAKLPDIPAAVAPKDFQTVALVGAGTMGGGIAMSFADFGYPVKIMDATTNATAYPLPHDHKDLSKK